MQRHLENVTVCDAKFSTLSRQELLQQLNVVKHNEEARTYDCACGSSYKYQSGLSRHKKTCQHTVQEQSRQDALEKTVAELQAKLQALENKPASIINNTTNNNTYITNNLNFVRNEYGQEKIDHIKDDHQFLRTCLENRDVTPLIENIYCD